MGKRATVRVWDWRGGELFKGAVLPVTPGQRAGLYQPVNLSALVWTGFLLSCELSAGWKPRCVIEQCMTAWKPRGFTSFITSPCTHTHTHTQRWLTDKTQRCISICSVCRKVDFWLWSFLCLWNVISRSTWAKVSSATRRGEQDLYAVTCIL